MDNTCHMNVDNRAVSRCRMKQEQKYKNKITLIDINTNWDEHLWVETIALD